jgi:hypothetical protein
MPVGTRFCASAAYCFAIKPTINGNEHNGRSVGTFPSIISASSVCSVAMTTNQDYSGNRW